MSERTHVEQTCAETLRKLIGSHGLSLAEVERRAPFGKDYLSQILRGNQHLKIHHIVRVLEVLDEDPGRFFWRVGWALGARADEVREPAYDLDYMERRILEEGARDRKALERERREDLERLVNEILDERLGGGGKRGR